MLSISHRLMWADLLESEEPHAVLIIEMTSCYGEIQRGGKNEILDNLSISPQIADLHFLHVCFIMARIIEFHEHVTAESARVKRTRILELVCYLFQCIFHACASLWWRRVDSFLSFLLKNVIRLLGSDSSWIIRTHRSSAIVRHERRQWKRDNEKTMSVFSS